MELQDFKKEQLPDAPGVYIFLGVDKEPLYIGKATSLRSRVRSYFDNGISSTRGSHIAGMVEMATTIDFIETDSVLEALILEANLIKKYRPHYNTKEKDDKSFNYVVITKEDFPRVLIVRAKELFGGKASKLKYDIKYEFGPFPQGAILKDALKIVRKIFPFRDRCSPSSGTPCFNCQIKLCPGVCTGEISKREYSKIIRNLKLFFEGEKGQVVKRLEREMRDVAKRQEFERAGEIKKTIFALKHIQDIALIRNSAEEIIGDIRIEAYDVAHISGKFVVGVMTVVEDAIVRKSDYRKFKIKSFEGVDDTRALGEILERRLTHSEWQLPRLFVVDGGMAQKNTAERVLRGAGVIIPVVGVVKDEQHRPKKIIGDKKLVQKYEKDILLANYEAHRFAIAYHRQLRGKRIKGMK